MAVLLQAVGLNLGYGFSQGVPQFFNIDGLINVVNSAEPQGGLYVFPVGVAAHKDGDQVGIRLL